MENRRCKAIPASPVGSFGAPCNPPSLKRGRDFTYRIGTGIDSVRERASGGMLAKKGGERKRKDQEGYTAGTVGTASNRPSRAPSIAMARSTTHTRRKLNSPSGVHWRKSHP